MFQFTGLLSYNYVFIIWYLHITIGEFPHSDISGSKHTYCSPKHFVVRHVLHQLLVPRHSLCALSNLITILFFFLIWWDILMLCILAYTQLPHYQVFKELFSWENNLSKPSKTINSIRFSLFLHRKEVIHPHVPVGIPCYDFTPITCPTFASPLLCRLGYQLRVLQTLIAWRAVCTTPGNVFTLTFWFRITSDSNFMESSCRLQSELGPILEICSASRLRFFLCRPL